MKYYAVFDIEADGLLKDATKIHCMVVTILDKNLSEIETIVATDNNSCISTLNRLQNECIFVGHNICTYDFLVIKKILGWHNPISKIDTLPVSWYLFPLLKEHGLEAWGNKLGIEKPIVDDWLHLCTEVYVNRCTMDVKINIEVLKVFISYLHLIYNEGNIFDIMYYLTFKMDCAAEQIENPLTISREHCEFYLKEIKDKIQDKKVALYKVMPKINKYVIKRKPSKMFNIKGILTKAGENWLELLADNDLETDFDGEISIIKSLEEPNPSSVSQLKNWLLSLGWKPTYYKISETKSGQNRVPQIQLDNKDLCPNILALIPLYPEVELLQGLFLLQHRQGIFKGFLECADENGKMIAEIAGLTNTLRFRHKKPIANLPGVGRLCGKEIREAIIAPCENHYFCGSDMSALESTTQDHYMMFYDPKYVQDKRTPGFDPHLDVALVSGILTEEQVLEHKLYESSEGKQGKSYKAERNKAKIVNFSGVYGAGPVKIAEALKCELSFAQKLHTAYWERNKAVKQIAKDCIVKTVNDQMWLYNPVSKFWYSLRADKDRFSTLNQGTGVYCFDTHVKNVRNQGIKISLQYHDEIGFSLHKEEKEEIKLKLNKAIVKTNQELRLNVPLGISIDVGDNYSQAH